MGKLTKQEAITLLECSPRSLNNYVRQRRIVVEYVPGRTRPVATFDRDEVLRLKSELQQTTHRPATANDGSQALARIPESAVTTAQPGNLELRGLPNFAQLKRALALPHKLQLNCRAAAMQAGESEETLRAAIKSRKLRARRAGNRWKIKRADLEAWVRRL